MSIVKAGVPALSEAELLCRMYEAVMGERRPAGLSAEECIDAIPDKDQRDDFLRAARAAMLYMVEQTEAVVITADRANRQAVIGDEVFSLH